MDNPDHLPVVFKSFIRLEIGCQKLQLFILFFFFQTNKAVKRVMGKLPLFFNEVQIGVEKLQQVVEAGMEDSQEDSEMILEVQEAKQRENAGTLYTLS